MAQGYRSSLPFPSELVQLGFAAGSDLWLLKGTEFYFQNSAKTAGLSVKAEGADGNGTQVFGVLGNGTSGVDRYVKIYPVLVSPFRFNSDGGNTSRGYSTAAGVGWAVNESNGINSMNLGSGSSTFPSGGFLLTKFCNGGGSGATGGSFAAISNMYGQAETPGNSGDCTRQFFYSFGAGTVDAIAPALPIYAVKTAQTASIAATNLTGPTPAKNRFYRVCGALEDTTAGSAGTVSAAVIYNDVNGNSQTDTLVSAVTLTGLGNHGQGCLTFFANNSASVQYSTTVTGLVGAQYAAQFTLETMSP
jgi:hypothetical protein